MRTRQGGAKKSENKSIIETKYATFDKKKLAKYPKMKKLFQKEQKIPQLHRWLWQDQCWEDVDSSYLHSADCEFDEQGFFRSMTDNYALTINFICFSSYPLLENIKFHRLQELHFGTQDYGYIDDLHFLVKMDAPNLKVLDFNNKEVGGRITMKPFKKAYFPQLEILDFSLYQKYGLSFDDFEVLAQGHFPKLKQIRDQNTDFPQEYGKNWMARMPSLAMRLQLEKQIQMAKEKQRGKPRKKVKSR